MKGRMGTTRPYRKRSVKRPMPTVLTMKVVLDLHLRPIGLDLVMFDVVARSGGQLSGCGGALDAWKFCCAMTSRLQIRHGVHASLYLLLVLFYRCRSQREQSFVTDGK